jgi:hypothetical protein
MAGRVRRAGVAATTVALLTTLASVLVSFVGPQAFAEPAPPVEVNVYVVRTPQENGGRPDSLRDIAERTLGTPERSSEIFDLNRGRRQPDGGALVSAADPLRPGWLLRLPGDARGPDVQRGVIAGASSSGGGIRIPVVLAVVGGLLLLQLTLAIIFRRQLMRGLRAARSAVAAVWTRRRAPARLRAALHRNRVLATRWRQDHRALSMASTVFAELSQVVRPPLAVEVHASSIVARTAAHASLPAPWQEDSPSTWRRPLPTRDVPGPPVVRIGGTADSQIVLDLSWCDGAVAVTGSTDVAREFVATMLAGLAGRPWAQVAVLGDLPAGVPAVRRLRGPGDVEALVRGRGGGAPAGPMRAGARRRVVHGVVAVSDEVDPSVAGAVAEICARADSTWIAVVVGSPVPAHWRWTVHGDGVVEVAMLERDVVAAL